MSVLNSSCNETFPSLTISMMNKEGVGPGYERPTSLPLFPTAVETFMEGSAGITSSVFAKKRGVPFGNVVHTLQRWIDILSMFLDSHLSVSLEMLLIMIPFLVGVWKVVSPPLLRYMVGWSSSVHQRVQRDIVAFSMARYNVPGTMGQDRNAILQHAIFFYLTKVIWERSPLPASVWRNKAASFLLVDPYRSRIYEHSGSPFRISSSDSEEGGEDGDETELMTDAAASTLARSKSVLKRAVLIKLPVSPFWVPIGVQGISISYSRQSVKIEQYRGVRRTVSLRAYGKEGDKRLEEFVHRALDYYIRSIPTCRSRRTRYFFELQPSSGSRGEAAGGYFNDSGGISSSTLLFKRYALADDAPLQTIFFPERERVWKLIDQFLFRKGRFAIEGFPYKLGFLLYGPPGTGKTAFVKALAAYTGRHVVSIPLHLIQTNQQLYDIFLLRSFKCVGEPEEKLPLEEIIFYIDDAGALNEVLWARQRRRVVWMRKPARLTASLSSHTEEPPQQHWDLPASPSRKDHADGDDDTRGEGGDEEEEEDPTEIKEGKRERRAAWEILKVPDTEEVHKGTHSPGRALATTMWGRMENYTRVIVELPDKRPTQKGGLLSLERGEISDDTMYCSDGASSPPPLYSSPYGEGEGSVSYGGRWAPAVPEGVSTGVVSVRSMPFSPGIGGGVPSATTVGASTSGTGIGGTGWITGGEGAGATLPSALKRSIFSMMDAASDKLDLSGILNVLDGVVDTPGRMVVMSTQHPERLDPALVRPGRISIKLRMDYIQFDALVGMAGLHFGEVEPSSPEEWAVTKKWEEIQKSLEASLSEQNKLEPPEKWEKSIRREGDEDASEVYPLKRTNKGSSVKGEKKEQLTGDSVVDFTGVSFSMQERERDHPNDGAPFPSGRERRGGKGLTHIPSEMIKAHLPVRRLSEAQVERLRKTILALEKEEEARQKEKKHCHPAQEEEKGTRRGSPSSTRAHQGYNFHIPPSAIEMICAEQEDFDGFLDGLVSLIKQEREY